MLMYQESMCDRYFSHSKTLEKMPLKDIFPVPILARKGTLPVNVSKTPLPGHRLTS